MATRSEFYLPALALMKVFLHGKNDACAEKSEQLQIVLQTLMMQIFVVQLAQQLQRRREYSERWKFLVQLFLATLKKLVNFA
jgi:hypothetical protein